MRRSNRSLRSVIATCITTWALLTTSLRPAVAIEPWRIVVRVQGRVESLEPGQTAWAPIFRSRRLNDGAFARTQAESEACINLADQSSFRIGPSSEVEMTKFQLTPEGRTVVFNLRFGKIRADVAKSLTRSSRFEVRTPNGVLAARGTEFSVTVMPETELKRLQGRPSKAQAATPEAEMLLAQSTPLVTLVTVHEGTVTAQLDGSNKSVSLHAGDSAVMTGGPSSGGSTPPGTGVPQVNPPGFPSDAVMPDTAPNPPSPQEQAVRAQTHGFQDPSLSPPGSTTNGTSGNGNGATSSTSPPQFSPGNTTTPLENTTGGQGGAGNTGRINIIVK